MNKKTGFTLIELLVVVLIIGILAAVAVPQYRKAVEKSRATEAITMLKSIQQACDLDVLENGFGKYAHTAECNLDKLTNILDFSSMQKVSYAWTTYCSKNFCYTGIGNSMWAARCAVQNYWASDNECGDADNLKYRLRITRSNNDGTWTKTYTPGAGSDIDLTSHFETMGFN